MTIIYISNQVLKQHLSVCRMKLAQTNQHHLQLLVSFRKDKLKKGLGNPMNKKIQLNCRQDHWDPYKKLMKI